MKKQIFLALCLLVLTGTHGAFAGFSKIFRNAKNSRFLAGASSYLLWSSQNKNKTALQKPLPGKDQTDGLTYDQAKKTSHVVFGSLANQASQEKNNRIVPVFFLRKIVNNSDGLNTKLQEILNGPLPEKGSPAELEFYRNIMREIVSSERLELFRRKNTDTRLVISEHPCTCCNDKIHLELGSKSECEWQVFAPRHRNSIFTKKIVLEPAYSSAQNLNLEETIVVLAHEIAHAIRLHGPNQWGHVPKEDLTSLKHQQELEADRIAYLILGEERYIKAKITEILKHLNWYFETASNFSVYHGDRSKNLQPSYSASTEGQLYETHLHNIKQVQTGLAEHYGLKQETLQTMPQIIDALRESAHKPSLTHPSDAERIAQALDCWEKLLCKKGKSLSEARNIVNSELRYLLSRDDLSFQPQTKVAALKALGYPDWRTQELIKHYEKLIPIEP